jgi:hypothetical protein
LVSAILPFGETAAPIDSHGLTSIVFTACSRAMYNSFTAGFGGIVEGHEEAQRARDCVRARPGRGDLTYAYGLYQYPAAT